ncbi:MAG TPA: FecR domain-containing protein [Steroidobacter sp.]
MADHNGSRLNAQISEEAAEWFVEFRTNDIDAAGRRAFDAWVRASPEHLRAYLEFAAIWNEAAFIDANRELDVDALISLASTQGNLVPLQPRASEPLHSSSQNASQVVRVPPRSFRLKNRARAAIAASVIFLAVLSGVLIRAYVQSAHTYATQVGERRSIRLPDGSTIELNSRSRVRVDFTEANRLVELLEGQALFEVAKDPSRPFVVSSGEARVRAVGTQFDVYRKSRGTVVTVVEGSVAVMNGARGSRSDSGPAGTATQSGGGLSKEASSTGRGIDSLQAAIILSAGQQLVISEHVVPEPVRVNVAAATAWTQRQVVLESASLAEVAEEFNRYSTRKLIVEDAGEKELRLSGVFATDPELLIRYLAERPDITVHETDDEIRIVRRR